jgi:hypothetical protein
LNEDLIVIGHCTAHGLKMVEGDVAKAIVDNAHPLCSVSVLKRQ